MHGTSHKYVSEQAAAFLGRPLSELKTIVLHLGNGASAAAVDGGGSRSRRRWASRRSRGSSWGPDPETSTRPSSCTSTARPGSAFDETDDILNKRSGLLGLTGNGDMRDVQDAASKGDEVAEAALAVYRHRIRRYVGAYTAQLGGLDAVVFTAGCVGGEQRAAAAARARRTRAPRDRGRPGPQRAGIREARRISTDGSRVAVLVIPTNEELEIARQSAAVAL